MTLNVAIDITFIDEVLKYLNIPNHENFLSIIDHDAAIEIYENAILSQSTTKTIEAFWEEILLKEKSKGSQYTQKILSNLEYIIERKSSFTKEFKEIEKFMPIEKNIKCRLYLMMGYDIGIANKDNALLNIGYPLFHQYPKELLYFSMHELHHVVFFHYHPIISLNEIKTTTDIINAIKYYTQLEGLATYLTLNKRITENELTFKDYQVLTNKTATKKIMRKFFKIIETLHLPGERPVNENDFKVFEKMSGGQRLWYIAGAHMAKTIDEIIGRDMLIKIMKYGPESFFIYYNGIMTGL